MSVTTAASLAAAVRKGAETLRKAGAATPELDARLLAAHAAGLSPAELIAAGMEPLEPALEARLADFVARRAAGEPVARLLGRREFWGLDFKLNSATLVPRPDSETAVEAALDWIDTGAGRDAPLHIADLGTGSGCLLVALLTELPTALGVGIDSSALALQAARQNAQANGVGDRAGFVRGHWAEGLAGRVDVIMANPPYIPSGTIPTLSVEVARHEPASALDGGHDGLSAYRALLPSAARTLAAAGLLVLEHGLGQQRALARLIELAGLTVLERREDLGGIARIIVAAPRQ